MTLRFGQLLSMQVLRQELSSSKTVNLKPRNFVFFLQLQLEPQLSTSASLQQCLTLKLKASRSSLADIGTLVLRYN
jgi:hypothetical protein